MHGSQSKRDEEKTVFNAFLAQRPDFASEPIKSSLSAESDPPDIICKTDSGRIGEPQPLNTSKHFDLVFFLPKDPSQSKFKASDNLNFRQAMIKLISDVELGWREKPVYKSRCIENLGDYPPFNKYLLNVRFHPGELNGDEHIKWILEYSTASTFDDQTMVKSLLDTIQNKLEKYQGKQLENRFDVLSLLIYFDQFRSRSCIQLTASYSLENGRRIGR